MHDSVLRIYIGYDPVESVAWHTMAHSIFSRSSRPVAIIPLNVANLRGVYSRARDERQSNAFSFTRFLVPFLNDYDGYGLFFDCDMMLRTDVSKILDVLKTQPDRAVYVVKHDYEPKCETKYLNTVQYKYPRKNWSSVVLWNCGHAKNRRITPDFVNTAPAMELHRFHWLADEEIGELDIRWNWLVGEYEDPPTDVQNVHWTLGGPYFSEYCSADFSDEWRAENARMTFCLQREQSDDSRK